jgi:hypothetical protein
MVGTGRHRADCLRREYLGKEEAGTSASSLSKYSSCRTFDFVGDPPLLVYSLAVARQRNVGFCPAQIYDAVDECNGPDRVWGPRSVRKFEHNQTLGRPAEPGAAVPSRRNGDFAKCHVDIPTDRPADR